MSKISAKFTTLVIKGREAINHRLAGQDADRGGALEYVAIALGGIIVAGIIVAAVTAFVNGKVAQF